MGQFVPAGTTPDFLVSVFIPIFIMFVKGQVENMWYSNHMAIRRINTEENKKITVEIDNGHLDRLRKITKDYSIKNGDVYALSFVIEAVAASGGQALNGIVPSDEITSKHE